MSPDTKICPNCNKSFTILAEDFSFYEKIKVPPPTFCPPCRSARRMVHRNERNLYKRKCDITGKDIISIYRADCPYTICDKDYYFSDEFDPFAYGTTYNPDVKFFEQFYEFAKKVPMSSLFIQTSENCDYNQDMSGASNCYLCSRTHDSQNMFYTYRGNKSSDCNDCFQVVEGSEFLYESVNSSTSSNSKFIHFCEKCSDSAFLYNCVGCVDSFMCTDQRNKQCYYKNQQYSREEYKKIIDSYKLDTYEGQQRALKEFEDFLKKFPRKNLTITRSENVSGDSISDSKDCRNVFNVRATQNCAYVWDSMKYTDSMDAYSGASVDLIYEATATTNHSSNCHFCVRIYKGSRDCEYSWFLRNCANCFGCISLKDKEYCIFNTQYSKEEYFTLLEKIKTKMLEDGEYGEFFPFYTSPFPYNDTVAQEYFPLDANFAKDKGLKWGEMEEKKHQATLSWSDLPEAIGDVPDSILQETISCKHAGECTHGCTMAFRIVADELTFYRRKGIPLPRECPNCRYYRRLEYRNPTKIRDTVCMCMGAEMSNGVYTNTIEHTHGASPCGKQIETTMKENGGFIIYCDDCYKKEVF
jgi:uncharacterized Fe-S cluster protein YjdI